MLGKVGKLSLALAGLLPPASKAPRARLKGAVQNPSGAVTPKAKVTLVSNRPLSAVYLGQGRSTRWRLAAAPCRACCGSSFEHLR